MTKQRDLTIDILRGIAIFTMIAANLGGKVLAAPHPPAFRLYGTFAAPLFILLSGLMVSYSSLKKSYPFNYFFLRGISVIGFASLIDIFIYRAYPLLTCDVLYTIGLSLILAYLFNPLKMGFKWLVVAGIFALTPFLQHYLGYTAEIPDLQSWKAVELAGGWQSLKRWLVDGWFPLFPWLGFSFLGVIAAALLWGKNQDRRRADSKMLIFGIAVTLLSGIYFFWQLPFLITRESYSELFYPPTIAYCLTAIGVIISIFSLVDLNPKLFFYRPLRAMGEAALFIYILHLALIEYLILPHYQNINLPAFLWLYCLLLLACFLTAYLLRIVRQKWQNPPPPFLVKLLIGS